MTTQPTHASSERGDAARTDTGRVKMAWFEHGSSRIYYEEQGRGTPVLVLPGFAGSIEEFAALREALVAAGYRVIAADLPGYGRSDTRRCALCGDLGRGGHDQRSRRTSGVGDVQHR